MAWTTEKVACKSDNTVAMLAYNIRHRFELTVSCIVRKTKRFGFGFGHFALLRSYLITEKLSGDKALVYLCNTIRLTHNHRAIYINKQAKHCPSKCHVTVKFHHINLPEGVHLE